MKTKTGKLATLFIVSIMALAGTSVGYALWSETLYIDGTVETGEVDWEFCNPGWYGPYGNPNLPPTFGHMDDGIDPGWTKDVGSNDAEFFDTDNDGDLDTMEFNIYTAYPGYNDHIVFAVHCNGNIPIHIWKVVFWDASGAVVGELYANGDVYIDLDGSNGDDLWISWGDNFGLQMHYCDWVDISFNFYVLQPCPQGQPFEFTIGIVAGQYNEV